MNRNGFDIDYRAIEAHAHELRNQEMDRLFNRLAQFVRRHLHPARRAATLERCAGASR